MISARLEKTGERSPSPGSVDRPSQVPRWPTTALPVTSEPDGLRDCFKKGGLRSISDKVRFSSWDEHGWHDGWEIPPSVC